MVRMESVMFEYSGISGVQSIYAARDLAATKRKSFNTALVVGGVVLMGSAGYYVHKNR